MQTVLFSKFKYVAFVTEHRGWLWKYIILLIYKTNFDSPYLMPLYTRHMVTTKPIGLTQRYCLHLQLQARLLSFPVRLDKAHFHTHMHTHTHTHTHTYTS